MRHSGRARAKKLLEVRTLRLGLGGGSPSRKPSRTRTALAGSQPSQAGAKGAPLPSGATDEWEIRERPKARCL